MINGIIITLVNILLFSLFVCLYNGKVGIKNMNILAVYNI